MSKLSWVTKACAGSLLWAMAAIALPAQTLTTLFSFDGTDGDNPYAGLVQATDGNLYGTTLNGGVNGGGAVFKITPSGTLTSLYSFCLQSHCTDGQNPYAGVIEGTSGNLYGTTVSGGADDAGSIFKITTSGVLTTLNSFDSLDGNGPDGGVVQGANGNLYGTTEDGGANNVGTVFTITLSGTLTTLYSFGWTGDYPLAGLVQATNGDFYGTTQYGGSTSCVPSGCGTVFKITPDGALTTLYSFEGADGKNPNEGALIQSTSGEFYGTTPYGGATSSCNPPYGCGTVFKLTQGGTLTTLHIFDDMDGANPQGGLVQGTDGDFYGTTAAGGANYAGTIFKITPGGKLTTLYIFCSLTNCTDGIEPFAGLFQATNGICYGTTFYGGTGGYGTIFSLSVGLGPFVETQPTFGPVGGSIKILGTDLTGTTSVTFNGTAAVFTVDSHSLISATVPTGATAGAVQVVTPRGTLSSNVPFRVRP
jgi:uncharacterized repeat protein (TIGR03803 family)